MARLAGVAMLLQAATAQWSQSAAVPPLRGTDGPAMVATSTGLLLYGGQSGSGASLNEVHSFTGNSWRTIHNGTGGAPGGRWRFCATFHAGLQAMLVVFGASTASGVGAVLPNVWAFSVLSNSWSELFSTSQAGVAAGREPAARHSHSCVQRGDLTVLFGGATASGALFGDVWAFNASAAVWFPVPLSATGAPAARLAHVAAYVPAPVDAMAVHGGLVDVGGSLAVSQDLWVLSLVSGTSASASPLLGSWNLAAVAGITPSRAFAGQAVYLPSLAALCQFGGVDGNGDISQSNSLLCMDTSNGFSTRTTVTQRLLLLHEPERLLPAQSAFPVPPASPAASPVRPSPVAQPWLRLSAAQPVPPPRMRHAAAELPAGVAAVWATSAGLPALAASMAALPASAGSGVLMLSAGSGLSASLSDTWLVALPNLSAASGAWTALVAPQDTYIYFLLLQYIGVWAPKPAPRQHSVPAPSLHSQFVYHLFVRAAYGIGLTVCTVTCFVCIVRRAMRNQQARAGGRGPRGGSDDGGVAMGQWGTLARDGATAAATAATRRGGGVSAEVISHLPTLVYSKKQSPPLSQVAAIAADGVARAASPPRPEEAGEVASELSRATPSGSGGGSVGIGSELQQQPNPALSQASPVLAVAVDGGGGTTEGAGAMVPATIAIAGPTGPTHPYRNSMTAFNPEEQSCCAICISDFAEGDLLRVLPCMHRYHQECADRWLAANRTCPLCKDDVLAAAC